MRNNDNNNNEKIICHILTRRKNYYFKFSESYIPHRTPFLFYNFSHFAIPFLRKKVKSDYSIYIYIYIYIYTYNTLTLFNIITKRKKKNRFISNIIISPTVHIYIHFLKLARLVIYLMA